MANKDNGQKAMKNIRRGKKEAPQIHIDLRSKVASYLIGVVIVLVPFHAFLTVLGAKLGANYTMLRLFPEVALFVLVLWICFSVQLKRVWKGLATHKLALPVASYTLLNLAYYVFTVATKNIDVQAAAYGLLLNTRHILWFVVVYAVVSHNKWLRENWRRITVVPLLIVSVFALLQFFVLSPDFLSHFGYKKGVTITPIQTINQDTETIRAQSFLRGPNPLGAYLLVGACLVWVAAFSRTRKYALLFAVGAAMFLSFSRSAWLGCIVSGLAWSVASKGFIRNARYNLMAAVAVLSSLVVLALLLQSNHGFQNAILHVNDRSTAAQTSNEGRLSALEAGLSDVIDEPFGRGLGTAGPASMSEDEVPARNSENYFLGLGQELGWVGMGLFITICYRLAKALYKQKNNLARAMFASLAGLTLVNLLSYAWADVTLVYLWWGLAAIALALEPDSKVTKRHG